ncbi:MAG: hypothetical protein AAGD14_02800 [Planctomycetota bacterium]
MIVPCDQCGAELRLNPKLAGTVVSCPQCGNRVSVPKAAPAQSPRPKPKAKLELEPEPKAAARRRTAANPQPAQTVRRAPPTTFYMLATQGVLLGLSLLCFVAAFKPGGWDPPDWSWFDEHPFLLMAFGVSFAFCGFMARYVPRLMALLSVLLVAGGIAAGMHFKETANAEYLVDASRTLALALALLAVWLALEHRRVTR